MASVSLTVARTPAKRLTFPCDQRFIDNKRTLPCVIFAAHDGSEEVVG